MIPHKGQDPFFEATKKQRHKSHLSTKDSSDMLFCPRLFEVVFEEERWFV
jgi:hypothetical protein